MTTNRISRYDGTNWNPIYDSAASLASVTAGGTTIPITSAANTLAIAAGTGVTVAGATGPNTVTLSIGQSVATTATPTFTSITLNAATGAKLTMSGSTSNWLEWNNIGVAAPAFTTRSGGTKLVLYPQVTASSVDYALGIESNTLWSSVPSSAAGFKWYAATTAIATLSGTGALSATSFSSTATSVFSVNGASGDALRLVGTSPYIGIHNAGATARTGYLQGNHGSDIRLVADSTSPLIILGAATVQVRDAPLTTIRTTVDSSGLTVNSGGFTITAGGVSLNANGGQRLAINGTTGLVAINMATSNGGWVCTPDGVGSMTVVASRRILKERIQSIPNSESMARIMGLRPVEFYFKRGVLSDDNDYTPLDLQRGFVAEEVAAVDHNLASWGWVDPADEYRTLSMELLDNPPDLNDAVPVMWNVFATITDVVGALQGALARVEILEDRLTAAGIQ